MHLLVTQRCNLRCIYCYGQNQQLPHEDMSFQTARKSIDWLFENCGDSKAVRIEFFGGEPLLNFTLIRQAVNYAEEQAEKLQKSVHFTMTTNATLMTQKVVRFLNQHQIKTMISLDGPAHIQDRQRPMKNSGKSHEVVLSNLQALFSAAPGIVAGCRATLSGSVSDRDAWKIKQYLWGLGFNAVFVSPATPLFSQGICSDQRKAQIASATYMIEQEANRFLSLVRDRDKSRLNQYKAGLLLLTLKRILNTDTRRYRCSSGRSSIAVSHDGRIYICHRFVGMENFCIGSVFNFSPQKFGFFERYKKLPDKCMGCQANILCSGGCLHENMAVNGIPMEPAEDLCRITLKIVSCARQISSWLSKDDTSFLKTQLLL